MQMSCSMTTNEIMCEKNKIVLRKNTRSKGTHQPLPVPLQPFNVQELNGDGLRFEPGPHFVVDVPLVHGAEPSFAEQVVAGEIVGDGPQLA